MPFTLRPVKGEMLIDREEILRELISTLSDKRSRIGFALFGPRRVGKTSILHEVERVLKMSADVIPIYFSLWELVEGTLIEFAREFSLAVLEAYSGRLPLRYRVRDMVRAPVSLLRRILGELQLSVKLAEDIEVLLTLGGRHTEDASTHLERALSLPDMLAAETGMKSVLLIDEFPSVLDVKNGEKVGDGVLRKWRTLHETQEHTVLCVSGSVRRTMQTAILSQGAAFYRQLVIKEVGPLTGEQTALLIEKNLQKEMTSEALDAIYEFSQGFPFYVQFIGRELERHTDERITVFDIETAVNNLLSEEADLLFSEEFNALTPNERLILLSMAQKDLTSPKEIAQAVSRDSSFVVKYLGYLEKKEIIEKRAKGVYIFTDPIFKQWLARESSRM
jgi:AAA+ ATPase superfamily predicted ATPase